MTDSGKSSDLVLLELSSAFLEGRSFVSMGENKSEHIPTMTCGVPQGSILHVSSRSDHT